MPEEEAAEIELFDIIAIDWWFEEDLITSVGIFIEENEDNMTIASSIMRREPINTGLVINKETIESIEILANYEYNDGEVKLH
jgi:hypothetical protein